MRKWYVALMVVGAGGLGVLALAVGGKPARRWVTQKLRRAPQTFQEWNEAAQQELDRLQSAIDGLASSMGEDAHDRGNTGGLPVM
jgi:hypothetical protein